jgi:hypothetical protein
MKNNDFLKTFAKFYLGWCFWEWYFQLSILIIENPNLVSVSLSPASDGRERLKLIAREPAAKELAHTIDSLGSRKKEQHL